MFARFRPVREPVKNRLINQGYGGSYLAATTLGGKRLTW
jgi:hypothetical protein